MGPSAGQPRQVNKKRNQTWSDPDRTHRGCSDGPSSEHYIIASKNKRSRLHRSVRVTLLTPSGHAEYMCGWVELRNISILIHTYRLTTNDCLDGIEVLGENYEFLEFWVDAGGGSTLQVAVGSFPSFFVGRTKTHPSWKITDIGKRAFIDVFLLLPTAGLWAMPPWLNLNKC